MLRKFIFIVATTFFAASLPLAAENIITSDSCFAHIDSNLYVVDTYLPRFTDEVYVGKISPAGYDVELQYPEFKGLSSKELKAIRQMQKNGELASDEEIDASGIIIMPSPAPTGGLNLEQTMLVDRKKGSLQISFCPIVRHEGQWKRILSCKIKVSDKAEKLAGTNDHAKAPARAEEALDPRERWAEHSVLAQGKWAKISVTKEGIYQLTASDVQKMGFSDFSKVKVYGYGGLLQDEAFDFPMENEKLLQTTPPDDLCEVPVHLTADGRLLFWAEGTMKYIWNATDKRYEHKQNHYATASYYFITEDNSPRTLVEPLPALTEDINPTTVTDVPYIAVLDNDSYSWYSGGRRMFDAHDFSTAQSHSFRLATPDLNFYAQGQKHIQIVMGASSNVTSTRFDIKLNNNKLGSCTVKAFKTDDSSAEFAVANFTNDLTSLSAEDNIFQITSSNNNKGSLDYIRINYPRHLQLTAEPYAFSPKVNNARLVIEGANANTRLWRIGQKGSPTVEIAANLNSEGKLEAITETGMRRFVAFDESRTYAAPTFVGNIENQDLHGHANVDYVIIVPTNGKLVAQANRLGELHKQLDGYSYSVVRADQLYNEFSSGTPDANAYRRYLKMMYDRAGEDETAMPRYLLFMGKSSWDNRFITEENKNSNPDEYLLCFEKDEHKTDVTKVGSVYSYCSDDFFGLLDDGEGLGLETERLDIALGRMVCSTDEEAKLLVDKTERYIKNEDNGSWKNTVAVLADDGDSNDHMICAEQVCRIIKEKSPAMDIQKVYWDRYFWTAAATGYTYPQGTARIRQLMKEGALLFNYSGHGSPNMISHYKLLQTPDFAEALSPHLAVWVLASCEIYPFDSGENNLAETSLYVPDGGSVGIICATRAVYADRNKPFNYTFSKYLFERDSNNQFHSLGEALRLTKAELIEGGGDKSINKVKYVCFGDPALRVSIPTGKVVLDAINDKPISEYEDLAALPAGSVTTFSGYVCAPGSTEVDESFDGNVSAIIYDCEETITCKNNKDKGTDKDKGPMVFNERTKNIFRGSTKAEKGRFTMMVVIPRDISYTDKPGRINFYAVTPDKTHEYNGFSESFCLKGTAETEEPDVTGPQVVAYINSIDNPDYTITDENPVLIADVSDDYGINNAGVSLGHDIELVLDGNNSSITNLNAFFNYEFGSYQRGQIVYEMKNLERGQHTATLRVWDVNNNVTITDVHFIVRSENAERGKDGYITATKNPATVDTRFITYFPADEEVEGLVIYEVYDTRGRCVYKQPINVAPGSSSSSHIWDLCGNDHTPVPAGVYFYRTLINTSKGQKATDAQKLIITRQ